MAADRSGGAQSRSRHRNRSRNFPRSATLSWASRTASFAPRFSQYGVSVDPALPTVQSLQGEQGAPPPRDDFFLPFQRVPVAVQSMGPDARLLHVNETWVEFTGYAPEQAVGHSFAEFLDGPSAERYLHKAVPEFLDTTPALESRSVEYRMIKASGEIADIVLTARPERDPATGRFLHSLSVISDITARNRAEAALRQAQKMEALGGLTSGVAHDFNNLLMIVLGSLQLLERRLPAGDARAARLLDAALQGARRGQALTTRLLAFARLQELAPLPLDPRQLVASLRPMLVQLLGPGIAIEEELPPDLWTLRADPNQLELALLNLAANARDAMPRGGRFTLSARNATVASLRSIFVDFGNHAVAPAGDFVVLAIRDTGTGMDEAALVRAVDPFFTTKGPGKGTGLGLSMVHGFAEQSGGALKLSSQPGAGTTAELWLPRTTEPVASSAAAQAGPYAPAGRRLRILLVDDDPLVLAGTLAMLEELGHDAVQIAASGEEALAVLDRESGFDLLLTDHMMPGLSGMQLAARARAMHPTLPILLASGFAELEPMAGAAWPRLRKPYGLADLAAALAAVEQP
jgi:PAS domain S-box-containing protein